MRENVYQILLVDDDPIERNGVRYLIDKFKLPLAVSEAANGNQALEVMASEHVDILFTDVRMPYMDGLELARRVQAAAPEVVMIIFSAYGEFEYAQKAMSCGVKHYLLKPVDVEEFKSTLTAAVEACKRRDAQARQYDQLKKADIIHQWLSVLAGRAVGAGAGERLEQHYGARLAGGMTLMQIETLDGFFAKYEKQVIGCAASCVDCEYEYINCYPNSSFIVLFRALPRAEAAAVASELLFCIHRNGDDGSVIVAEDCADLADLARKARMIDDFRRRQPVWVEPVIYAADMGRVDRGVPDEIEKQWAAVFQAITAHDRKAILSETGALLRALEPSRGRQYANYLLYGLLSQIYVEYRDSLEGRGLSVYAGRLAACGDGEAILALFGEMIGADRAGGQEQDVSRIVNKVIRLIKERYGEDLSLSGAADYVGLAPAYLSYLFKRETGKNFVRFLTDWRLEQARRMLDDSSLKIAQVAKLCGYENPSYFNRIFKNTFAITPKQYREKKDG